MGSVKWAISAKKGLPLHRMDETKGRSSLSFLLERSIKAVAQPLDILLIGDNPAGRHKHRV